MTNPRMRVAAVAGTMALALSAAAAPALAQDDPAAAIEGFMDAVVAKDFEAMPALFCEAQAEQAAEFDLSSMADEMPPGMDAQSLLDAFVFDIQLDSIDVLSESETEAVVHVVGSMAMDVDPEPLVPFIELAIEEMGMPVDDATIDMVMALMLAEFEAESETIDADITLVPGDAGWLICSDLSFGDDMMEDDMMEDDMVDDSDMDDDMEDGEDGE